MITAPPESSHFIEGRITVGSRTGRLVLDPTSTVQRQIATALTRGVGYEPETVALLTSVLRPGDGFVDVGAHAGYFSVVAATAIGPHGRVWAFEPNADNYTALLRQVSLVEPPQIRPIPMAVGACEGVVSLHANLDNDGGHALWDPAIHPASEPPGLDAAGATKRPHVRCG